MDTMLATHQTPPAFPAGVISPDQPSVRRPRRVKEKGRDEKHADFLDLPGLKSDPDVKEGKCIIQVSARQVGVPTYPADCVCLVKSVKSHTPFIMPRVFDTPRSRKSVVIVIERRRWRCKTCGKTVTQPLDCLTEGRHQMTRRLLEYIEVQSLLQTELSLAEETGIFVRKIREIRGQFVDRLKDEVEFDTPYVFGLDGVRADKRRRRVILTDIEAGLVLDLLESGSKKSIADRIREFPGWEKIGIFTIDMCRTQCAAILDARPDAVIVIDLFHIMRIANQVMDLVRNRLFPREKKKREPGRPK